MIKLNNLTKVIGTAALLISANAALAETLTVPASVTVNSAIDFTREGELHFGEIRATADVDTDGACVALGLPANPAGNLASVTSSLCTSDGDAEIRSVGGTPSRPEFTIAGVSPFTDMILTLPDDEIILDAAVGPGRATFTVGNFTAYRTSGTAGDITLTAGIGGITTTAAGIATFTVGAHIATHVGDDITDTSYENDIPYDGTFEVTVDY